MEYFLLFGLTSGLLVTFALAFLSTMLPSNWKGVFAYLSEEECPKWWLNLHKTFTYMASVFFLLLAIICAYLPLAIEAYKNAAPAIVMLTGIALFTSVMGLWFAHKLLGMEYKWFCKSGFLGIQSYSANAYEDFSKENGRGIGYLLRALTNFQGHLKRNQLKNDELETTIKILRCIYVFKFQVPYDDLKELAFAAERLPSIESFDSALLEFNKCQAISWSKDFQAIDVKKRPPFEWIAGIAALLAAFTFVPETTRSTILGYLGQWSTDNFLFILGFAFILGVSIMVSIDSEYRINPLRDSFQQSKGQNNNFKDQVSKNEN